MSYINTERALLYGPDRIFSGIFNIFVH